MGRKSLDIINVVDVEATCWEGAPPPGQEGEIIEIGIAEVDVKAACVLRAESILIKPVRSEVSAFCTKLTTLTAKDLENGTTFARARDSLVVKYSSEDRVWASWGDYDRNQFERDSRSSGARYPFGGRHINLKTLFSVMHGLHGELGMDKACEHLGMTPVGVHHRGGDDAKNIANLLVHLLERFRKRNPYGPTTQSGI